MGLTDTPQGGRLHIGLYGRRNSGKSSLMNALAGQEIALTSPQAGTTADPVAKAMELPPIGPVLLIDTAGFDDEGELGALRVQKTRQTLERTDIALLVFPPEGDLTLEMEWAARMKRKGIPVVPVLNKSDLLPDGEARRKALHRSFGMAPVEVSAQTGAGLDRLREALIRQTPEDFGGQTILGELVEKGDTVLLVMPQNIQAPKGRLILPQVQTIRELLDRGCTPVCATAEGMSAALAALKAPPKLIVTDSQCFPEVYAQKPAESVLTSFSLLFAAYKGDILAFLEGAGAISRLRESSHVLIAEACTHAPQQEDIGRVKLPRLLRKRVGSSLRIEVVSGTDFPADLAGYDLVIHCGACMFNRRYVLNRVRQAQEQGVPITNYGVALACLSGILDRVVYPGIGQMGDRGKKGP
ncbi:MAG: [FeFe] hydrogenase H-cluster maturation GTPase HydF, partial [Clostridiales bacterium]|nr:[FeFe] hydrogenase H-cluster maturation GTPase HydF [Clostridiales bacterium]